MRRQRVLLLGISVFLFGASLPAQESRGKPRPQSRPKTGSKPAPEVVDLESFRLKPDRGWKMKPVSSSVRKAHFVLPAPEEKPGADAELIVYYFGSGGAGQAGANIQRWKDEFTPSPGRSADESAETKTLIVNGLTVSVLEVHGTWKGPSFQQRTDPVPNFMLLAAVVETEGGFHYLKTTGPETTLEHWKKRWYEMISAIEPKSK